MGGAQAFQGRARARMIVEGELGPRQTEHESVIGSVDAGQAALEQLPGLGGAPAAQAFLRERGPVLDGIGVGHPLRLFAQVALGVDHRADVPHRLAGGVAVAQVGQDLHEQVGEAAGERQPHDDEEPIGPAGRSS